ncbi:hypothetical protein thsrh120_31740 [Rhizobium sp. No.120]
MASSDGFEAEPSSVGASLASYWRAFNIRKQTFSGDMVNGQDGRFLLTFIVAILHFYAGNKVAPGSPPQATRRLRLAD